MEAVFRALGDPSRRLLLDRLYERDGQTLAELDEHLGDMTRFGVMKHLRVLESAGLVTTRRAGREKLHYLNPVPIRLVHDRWISKFAEPWVGALGALKRGLEERQMASTEAAAAGAATRAPMHVYEVYIRTTPERLWDAITSADDTRRYYHGSAVESDWRVGSPIVYRMPDGAEVITGEVVELDRPRRLVHTFQADWGDSAGERASRVTWEIEPAGEAVKLTLTHDGFDGETATYRSVARGWNPILSGLKTLLETGEPLAIGG